MGKVQAFTAGPIYRSTSSDKAGTSAANYFGGYLIFNIGSG